MAVSLLCKGRPEVLAFTCWLMLISPHAEAQNGLFDEAYDLPLDEYTLESDENGTGFFLDYDDTGEFEDFLDRENQKLAGTPRGFVIAAVYAVVIVAAVFMNLIAIVVSQRCSVLRYSQRLLMQNLCTSCLLLVLTMVFSALERLLDNWNPGPVLCKVANSAKSLTIFTQAYFVVAVCADYVDLKKRPRKDGLARTIIEIATVTCGWLAALGYALPLLIFTDSDAAVEHGQCRLFAPAGRLDSMQKDTSTYGEINIFGSDVWSPAYAAKEESEIPPESSLPECKEPNNLAYFAWIYISFVTVFAFPALICFILFILNKFLPSKRAMLVTSSPPETSSRARKPPGTAKSPFRRCQPAGCWVFALCAAHFASWLPLHVYHLGRIVGLRVGLTACYNLRDYSFLQGYLTCIFLPAIVIAYSRPLGARSCSRTLTTSSTSSFASSSSGGSNRKSMLLQANGENLLGDGPCDVPLIEQQATHISQQREEPTLLSNLQRSSKSSV